VQNGAGIRVATACSRERALRMLQTADGLKEMLSKFRRTHFSRSCEDCVTNALCDLQKVVLTQ